MVSKPILFKEVSESKRVIFNLSNIDAYFLKPINADGSF